MQLSRLSCRFVSIDAVWKIWKNVENFRAFNLYRSCSANFRRARNGGAECRVSYLRQKSSFEDFKLNACCQGSQSRLRVAHSNFH